MGLLKTVKMFKELGPKEFLKRFKDGVAGITPLQQTVTTLWSFIPVFGGLFWGIVVTFLAKTYWLSLILAGSLPITGIQFISKWQTYKQQKRIEEAMKNVRT